MSTSNAFALLPPEENENKAEKAAKKKEVKKAAPKKAAPAPAKKEAPKKEAPKKEAPRKETEVRGSKVPDSALEHKRGGEKPSGKKLAIVRNGKRPPKREFDRHDGTGRAHEGMKKGGAGRGNWGKSTDRHVDEEKPHDEQEQEEKKKPEPEMTEEEKAKKELLEKQRTYEQYQSKQNSGKAVLHTAAPVEVECSVDEKNFAPLTRVDLVAEQEKVLAAEKAPKKAAKAEKAKKAPKEEKPTIQIQFSEGRREHHKEVAKPVKLSTSDEKAFPSLA